MKLRKYQKEAVESVTSSYRNGVSKQLVVLPTGSGKTVIMAELLKRYKNKKTLIISHRKEILYQTRRTIKEFAGIDAGSFSAKNKDLNPRVIVGSIQSCCRGFSLALLSEQKFKILIIDEAHHSAAPTYRKLIECLGFDGSNKLLLGFTATPNLTSGNTLGDVYDDIVYSKQLGDLIRKGHLSEINGRKIRVELELSDVALKRGDYSKPMLARVMNKKDINDLIVEKYKKYALNTKAIAFCVSLGHAEALSNAFVDAGIKSSWVSGYMKDDVKNKTMNDLRDGVLDVVTSVGVLTEGFDMPSLRTIIMGRPTRSRSLYIQMIGRGLRTAKDKKHCTVLDFVDKDHSLKQSISLDIAIPGVEIDIEPRNGDSSSIPSDFYDEFDVNIKSIIDEELRISPSRAPKETPVVVVKPKCEHGIRAQNSVLAKLKAGEIPRKAPFGYKNICRENGTKTAIVVEKEKKIVLFIYETYINSNCSFFGIVDIVKQKFGVSLDKGTVIRILSNPFYIGIMESKIFGDFKHKYECIVPVDLFEKAAEKRLLRNSVYRSRFHLYGKLITCGECGCAVTGDFKKGTYTYYHCTQSRGKHGAIRFREEQITAFFVGILSKICMKDDIADLIVSYFRKEHKSFNVLSDKKARLFIYKLSHDAPRLFVSASKAEKRRLINMVFFNIRIKESGLTYELKGPFDKII